MEMEIMEMRSMTLKDLLVQYYFTAFKFPGAFKYE